MRVPDFSNRSCWNFTNFLLVLLVIEGAIAAFGIIIMGSIALSRIDFVAFNDAVYHIRDGTKQGVKDYVKVRDSLPFNVTDVIQKTIRDESDMESFSLHMYNGLVGTSSVVQEMDKIKFVNKVTPLIVKLAEASATDIAKNGSLGFGKMFNFIGTFIDTRDPSTAVSKILNSTATVAEKLAKTEVDSPDFQKIAKEMGIQVTELVKQFVKQNVATSIHQGTEEIAKFRRAFLVVSRALSESLTEDPDMLTSSDEARDFLIN